jgi:putative RNA 2'-phosphotransferase
MSKHTHISKLLSLALRHKPETIGITLDENGWTGVNTLLIKLNEHGSPVDMPTLQQVVETNDKKRFAFNDDQTKIRASQGHSITVDLNLAPAVPPFLLYHGTVAKFMSAIRKEGLKKQNRQHVHLSADKATAAKVGGRRGQPVILTVEAKKMHNEGHIFYQSANGVWLTNAVPPAYINLFTQ